MSFLYPTALLALLAIPVVLALHLFRRRFSEKAVAGLFLFAPDGLAAQAGRTRTRLLKTASLWLELAAASILALWLAGLCFGVRSSASHVVIVLDDSASMAAAGGRGRASERVASEVRRLLDELPHGSAVTLIATGRRPRTMAGPRGPVAEARAALELWSPREPFHVPGPAIDLGIELAEAEDELHFLTDRPDFDVPPRYRYVALGESLPNAAIAGGRRVLAADGEKVLVDLMCWAREPMDVELRLSVKDEELRERVRLEPGKAVARSFTPPSGGLPVEVELSPDALSLDNRLVLLPEPRRAVGARDLLSREASDALELRAVLAAVPGVTVSDADGAHLVFREDVAAIDGARVDVVLKVPEKDRDAWKGPYLIQKEHPLMEGVSLEGVIWTSGRDAIPGFSLISAGNQAILSIEHFNEGSRFTLNLDPSRSNLPSSPAWPILISNLVESVRAALPGPQALNLRTGDLIIFRCREAPEDPGAVFLKDPAGLRRAARGGRVLAWDADTPGIYELRSGGEVEARYSVHFSDARESDLTGCGAREVEPERSAVKEERELAASSGRTEGRALAVLLLAILVGDWLVLMPRLKGGGR